MEFSSSFIDWYLNNHARQATATRSRSTWIIELTSWLSSSPFIVWYPALCLFKYYWRPAWIVEQTSWLSSSSFIVWYPALCLFKYYWRPAWIVEQTSWLSSSSFIVWYPALSLFKYYWRPAWILVIFIILHCLVSSTMFFVQILPETSLSFTVHLWLQSLWM